MERKRQRQMELKELERSGPGIKVRRQREEKTDLSVASACHDLETSEAASSPSEGRKRKT